METVLHAVETASKKVISKAGEFIGDTVTDAIPKSNDVNIEKQEPVEEITIPPEKKMKY